MAAAVAARVQPHEHLANGHSHPSLSNGAGATPGVTTTVSYGKAPADGQEYLFSIRTDVKEGQSRINYEREEREVFIADLRRSTENFNLLQHGFQLEELVVPDDIDWSDDKQKKERYYPLVQQLIKRATGASRMHIFDDTVRNGFFAYAVPLHNMDAQKNLQNPKARGPVSNVHVDYTVESGPHRIHEVLPEEADRLKKTPFAVIQVWRPLKGPVKEAPLAVVDARSVSPRSLHTVKLVFPHRVGHTYTVGYDPGHKFYYAKDMRTDEAFVFTCYDSRSDRARFTPHTSFPDPTTPPDAPPRESIEIRGLCILGARASPANSTEALDWSA